MTRFGGDGLARRSSNRSLLLEVCLRDLAAAAAISPSSTISPTASSLAIRRFFGALSTDVLGKICLFVLRGWRIESL